MKGQIEAGSLTATDLRSLYGWSREYFVLQRALHRFPGAYVEKAFNLAIKGLHYEVVMRGIAGAATSKHEKAAVTTTSCTESAFSMR